LFPDFPYALIQIADTKKPFLPAEQYHFSISHCGDYAAAIVSRTQRVGVDIEMPVDKIMKIQGKFTREQEFTMLKSQFSGFNAQSIKEDPLAELQAPDSRLTTLIWSAKEAVFKWY